MTNQELLTLAARAAGYPQHPDHGCEHLFWVDSVYLTWDPLINDDEALRLAVRLEMDVNLQVLKVKAPIRSTIKPTIHVELIEGNDLYAATRRAIVRAAAEVGRNECTI